MILKLDLLLLLFRNIVEAPLHLFLFFVSNSHPVKIRANPFPLSWNTDRSRFPL